MLRVEVLLECESTPVLGSLLPVYSAIIFLAGILTSIPLPADEKYLSCMNLPLDFTVAGFRKMYNFGLASPEHLLPRFQSCASFVETANWTFWKLSCQHILETKMWISATPQQWPYRLHVFDHLSKKKVAVKWLKCEKVKGRECCTSKRIPLLNHTGVI